MKGTIDVQIKHKDGSIETRHEHNVVFDLPALVQKYLAVTPIRALMGHGTFPDFPYSAIDFALSEDLADLTKPAYRPMALKTQSGSSSYWWASGRTRTVTDKAVTIQGTWTVQEAMTLKSVFMYGNSKPTVSLITRIDAIIDEYGTYQENYYTRNCSKKLTSADYKCTNTYFGRLISASEVTVSDGVRLTDDNTVAYYHYPLANSNERYRIVTSNGTPIGNYRTGSNISPACTLQIINPETNAVTRSFLLSQFTGFITAGSSAEVIVIHSETKNWLIQPASSTVCRIWQIPDASTEDPIAPLSEAFSPNLWNKIQCVVGSYFTIGSASSSSYTNRGNSHTIYRITDDGTAVSYHGASGTNRETNSTDSYTYPRGHMFDGLFIKLSSNTVPSNGLLNTNNVYYTNLTAANFSTPIELAQGDVLTVSYKIEVS